MSEKRLASPQPIPEGEHPPLDGIYIVDLSTPAEGHGRVGVADLICRLLTAAGAQVERPRTKNGLCGHPHPDLLERIGRHNELLDASPDVLLVDDDSPRYERDDTTVVVELGESVFTRRGWPARSHEMAAQANTGVVWEQSPDRPEFNGMHLATHGAAVNGATAIVAALIDRLDSGRGQRLRVSTTAAAITSMSMVWSAWTHDGIREEFAPVGAKYPTFRCADGRYIILALGPGRHAAPSPDGTRQTSVQLLAEAIGYSGNISSLKGTSSPFDLSHYYMNVDLISEYIARIPSEVILQRLRRADLAAELVREPGAVFHDDARAHDTMAPPVTTCTCGAQYLAVPIEGF